MNKGKARPATNKTALLSVPNKGTKTRPSVRDLEEKRKDLTFTTKTVYAIVSLACIWYTLVSILTLVIS